MKTTVQNHASGEHKKIIMVILIIIAIVAIIAAIIFNLTGSNDANTDTNTQTASETGNDAQDQESQGGAEDNSDGQTTGADTQAQIESLILQYRTAFAQADIESLKTIYNTSQVMNADVITATAKIISGYENTVCYIKNGMDDTSKVVFIYDDLKIDGIETLIPNVAYVYVMQKEDGSYYIYPGEYSDSASDYVYSTELQMYINDLIKEKDISQVYTQASDKLTKIMAEDPDAAAFIRQLTAGENSEAESGETTESQSLSDTSVNESETVSGSETNASDENQTSGNSPESESQSS